MSKSLRDGAGYLEQPAPQRRTGEMEDGETGFAVFT
jgi:hypothetical protein